MDEQPIDFDKLMEEFDNDYAFTIELIDNFIVNARSQCCIIDQALSDHDAETIRRSAHSIKGGALNLRSDPLSHLAFELENSGKINNLTNVKNLLNQLEETINNLEIFTQKKQKSMENIKNNENK